MTEEEIGERRSKVKGYVIAMWMETLADSEEDKEVNRARKNKALAELSPIQPMDVILVMEEIAAMYPRF